MIQQVRKVQSIAEIYDIPVMLEMAVHSTQIASMLQS